jgi:hypothetical protein
MIDLDRQIEDLIAAAALDDDDADDLRAAMAEVKARKDAKLRGEVQRTVGETHLTLREGMDRIIGLQIDTRGALDDAVRQIEAQGATQEQAWRDFHSVLGSVGERIDQFGIRLDEHTDRIAALMELGKQWERRFELLTKRVDQHDTMLAAHDARLTDLEAYAASVPPEERQRVIAVVEESEQRYQEIQAQLAELLANQHAGS